MTRRTIGCFITLALGLLVAPIGSQAQQAAHIPRVGFLDPGHPGDHLAFRQGLHALGYEEGQTIIVERRSWEGRPERAPELIAELIRLPVDVLVVAGSRLVPAAKKATTTIPIVMIAGGDPVTTGLIASFARPGGNMTGLTVHHPEFSGKTLELLKETFPISHGSPSSWRRAVIQPPCDRWSVRPRRWAWRYRS